MFRRSLTKLAIAIFLAAFAGGAALHQYLRSSSSEKRGMQSTASLERPQSPIAGKPSAKVPPTIKQQEETIVISSSETMQALNARLWEWIQCFGQAAQNEQPPVIQRQHWQRTKPSVVIKGGDFQEKIKLQKENHERLMAQARKERAAQEERWRKAHQDSLAASARLKAERKKAEVDAFARPGVIIGPVIGPYNNPFVNVPPHIMVKILSARNKK